MRDKKRIFLIVLDSFGVGELPDAADFGDTGAFTLRSCYQTGKLNIPVMQSMGLFNIDGIDFGSAVENPSAAFCRINEKSAGKDTTIGHWEIAGVISESPLPVYPDGFPDEIIKKLEKETGRKILCNKPYSGTQVIHDFGEEHMKTGALIVYTSADSVCQIAAHEDIVPIEELYEYCKSARKILAGKHGVGRIIARPFTGTYPEFTRTVRRHDFSIVPPSETVLDALVKNNYDTIAVGKINDIFAGCGVSEAERTTGNTDGMNKTDIYAKRDFNGLCFVNLVDFDMIYGHRRDADGYTQALNEFDSWLGKFIGYLGDNDILMVTADHGCDPKFHGTDHTREYTPLLVYGQNVRPLNLGTRNSFADIAASVSSYFDVAYTTQGTSFLDDITKSD